ncbi:MAG: hypothetical protein KGH49_03035 [Candidatus Micrarchaeota archaeon]|nr:hypothetical protein [Candidatus Micrarchaeota archaeon]
MDFHLPKARVGGMPKDLKALSTNRQVNEEIDHRKDALRRFERWRMTVEEWIREVRPGASQREITAEVDEVFEKLAKLEIDQGRRIKEAQEMKINSSCVGDISYFEVLQRPNI